jgi:cation transport regulator
MPYSSNSELPKTIRDALPAKAQTIYRKAFNAAYETYNGDEKKAFATAWSQVKTKYEKKNDKWVLIKQKSKVTSGGIAFDSDSVGEWVPVAMVGQEGLISPDQTKIVYTKDALANSVDSWKGGAISFNHDPTRIWAGEKILAAKFEEPYLYMKLSDAVRKKLKDETVSGCSIEGIPGEITEDAQLTQVNGSKLTLMEYPLLPACKLEEGCGIVASNAEPQEQDIVTNTTSASELDITVSSQSPVSESTTESTLTFDTCVVNNEGHTVKVGTDTIYGTEKQLKDNEYIKTELSHRGGYYGRENLLFYNADNTLKLGDIPAKGSTPAHTMTIVLSKEDIKHSSRGGDVERMNTEEPITYTGEQVKEMVTSAVGEAETNLKNQYEVDLNALKEKEEQAKHELEERHATELKEARETAFKKAEAISDFKAKFKPSEEVLKQAEELEPEALAFFNGLDIPMQERHSGVTSAAPEQEEEQNGKDILKELNVRYARKLGRKAVEG